MVSEEEARKKAMKGLRFDFGGTMLHLGRPRFSEESNMYVFSILISYPRLPDNTDEDITFDDTKMVGEIIIDKETGELTHTPSSILNNRVGEIADTGDVKYSDN